MRGLTRWPPWWLLGSRADASPLAEKRSSNLSGRNRTYPHLFQESLNSEGYENRRNTVYSGPEERRNRHERPSRVRPNPGVGVRTPRCMARSTGAGAGHPGVAVDEEHAGRGSGRCDVAALRPDPAVGVAHLHPVAVPVAVAGMPERVRELVLAAQLAGDPGRGRVQVVGGCGRGRSPRTRGRGRAGAAGGRWRGRLRGPPP